MRRLFSQEVLNFEVVLDSGAVDHVADNIEAPGYTVDSTAKSSANFATANGEPIENKGVMTLNLITTEGHPIKSKFQVCEVSRPLWSVGKICDSGCKVIFTADKAEVVQEKTGKTVCGFKRQGGLYVGNLRLSRPNGTQPFTRPGGH